MADSTYNVGDLLICRWNNHAGVIEHYPALIISISHPTPMRQRMYKSETIIRFAFVLSDVPGTVRYANNTVSWCKNMCVSREIPDDVE